MADRPRFDTMFWLGVWLALCAAVIFFNILPLPYDEAFDTGFFGFLARIHLFPQSVLEQGLPQPDLLLVITLCWILRRPAQVPALAIVLVFLIEGLLTMRPPGLWALIVLGGSEFLRHRYSVLRELNLLLEWGVVAAVIAVMVVLERVALAIVMVPRPPLALSLTQLVFTVATYPIVALLLQFVFRVHKPATGEVDDLGRRL